MQKNCIDFDNITFPFLLIKRKLAPSPFSNFVVSAVSAAVFHIVHNKAVIFEKTP